MSLPYRHSPVGDCIVSRIRAAREFQGMPKFLMLNHRRSFEAEVATEWRARMILYAEGVSAEPLVESETIEEMVGRIVDDRAFHEDRQALEALRESLDKLESHIRRSFR